MQIMWEFPSFLDFKKFPKISIQAKMDFLLNLSVYSSQTHGKSRTIGPSPIKKIHLYLQLKKPGQSDDKRIPIQSPNSSQIKRACLLLQNKISNYCWIWGGIVWKEKIFRGSRKFNYVRYIIIENFHIIEQCRSLCEPLFSCLDSGVV